MSKRLVAILASILVLMPSGLPITPGTADDTPPPGLTAGEWKASSLSMPIAIEGGYTIVSDFPVNAIMVDWSRATTQTDAMAEVSVSRDGRQWSPWLAAPIDENFDGRFEHDRRFSIPVLVQPGRYIRVRGVNALGQPDTVLEDLKVSYLNTLAGPETNGPALTLAKRKPTPTPEPEDGTDAPLVPVQPTPSAPSAFPAARTGNIPIISRSDWGADESLRFRGGKEIWPKEYQTVEKVVLHHTETPNDQDPMAAIRAVYYFHAIRKGWGDIGYNYLIDSSGRIYEGRFGGEHVIAGHALRYNPGSIGIAVIGSFQAASISPATEEAIVSLIAAKANFVDPIGQGWFVDKNRGEYRRSS